MDVLTAARRVRQVLRTAQDIVALAQRPATERPLDVVRGPVTIPRNVLLQGVGSTLDLGTVQMMKALSAEPDAEASGRDSVQNFARISDEQLGKVDRHYGPQGLWQLATMAVTHGAVGARYSAHTR